jgi:hypothetical protein
MGDQLNMTIKQLLLRLPENIYKDLKIRAIQEGKRVSQLTLEWFQEKLRKPFQSAIGSENEDDPVIKAMLEAPIDKKGTDRWTKAELDQMCKDDELTPEEHAEIDKALQKRKAKK